jgi:dienelactone hydrolase
VPAVVVPEGLGGLIDDREFRYGRFLAANGYAVLVVDSFTPRGAAPLSHPRRALAVTESMMLADAFGALRYLGSHPLVDPDRIHIFGFSYGGMISVLSAYENIRRVYMGDNGLAFAGHVSYYGCSVARVEAPQATGAPVLMMLAGLDKNVSMKRTQQIADDLRHGGSPVELVVFENIYHQWDGRDETVRYVPFNLSRCRMRLGADYKVRDERTGIAVRGRISRALVIASSVWSGYEILRDVETRKRSDKMLLSFFASTAAARAGAAMPEGVAAAAR